MGQSSPTCSGRYPSVYGGTRTRWTIVVVIKAVQIILGGTMPLLLLRTDVCGATTAYITYLHRARVPNDLCR
ncbi:hypothetical protein AGR4B_pAt20533 [Agrobacterium tumefaciens str. CFBP 5621]|nr:hypothetical protein AGR4B_pAt20533 [Agrobacterium tumefaciens str. CFBP 5621]